MPRLFLPRLLPARLPLPRLLPLQPIHLPRGALRAGALFLALATFPGAPAPGVGQTLEYGVESFTAHLVVEPDGIFDVHETMHFRVNSGSFGQGYREIPVPRRAQVLSVEVSSPEVEIEELSWRHRGGTLTVTWDFEERDTSASFTLRYRVEGALLQEDGRNVVDWSPVGEAWEVPLESVVILVTLPFADLPGDEIRAEPVGEASLSATPAGDGWRAEFQVGEVEAGTPWSLRVSFPAQIDAPAPPPPSDARLMVLGLLLALVGGALPGWLTWRQARPTPSLPRGVMDGPPNVTPEAATALALGSPAGVHGWQHHVVPPMVVSLARRGHARLDTRPDEDVAADEPGSSGTSVSGAAGASASPAILRVRPTGEDRGAAASSSPLRPAEAQLLGTLADRESLAAFLADDDGWSRDTLTRTWADLEAGGLVIPRKGRTRFLLGLSVVALGGFLWVVASLRHEAPAHFSIPAFILFATLMAASFVGAAFVRDLSPSGARLRAEVLEWMEHLRGTMSRRLDRDPEAAGSLLMEHLEWFLLDPRVGPDWFQGVERRLAEADVHLPLPGWILAPAGGGEDALTSPLGHPLAIHTFLPLYLLGSPGQSGGTAGGGAVGTGFSGTGMGTTGSFGGGGGGIR
jgi:hypothetical protein